MRIKWKKKRNEQLKKAVTPRNAAVCLKDLQPEVEFQVEPNMSQMGQLAVSVMVSFKSG